MEVDELERSIRTIFDMVDVNGSGALEQGELEQVLKQLMSDMGGESRSIKGMRRAVTDVVAQYDHDGSGALEFSEFVRMCCDKREELELQGTFPDIALVEGLRAKHPEDAWEEPPLKTRGVEDQSSTTPSCGTSIGILEAARKRAGVGAKTKYADLLGNLGQEGTIELLKDPKPTPDPSPNPNPSPDPNLSPNPKDLRGALIKAEAACKAREPSP